MRKILLLFLFISILIPATQSTALTTSEYIQEITICYTKADGTKETLTIPHSQLQTDMLHGDRLGICSPDDIIQH